MNNDSNILIKINKLTQETTSYDFPFLSNTEKKTEIINNLKEHIEREIKKIVPELVISDEVLSKIWNESLEHANKSFESLSPNLRLNGFYLQELMYCYSEKLGEYITTQSEDKINGKIS